jgi:hypothetical protein
MRGPTSVTLALSLSHTPRNIFPIWALGLYRRLVLLGQTRGTAAAAAAKGRNVSSNGSNKAATAAAEGAVVAPGTAWLCCVSDFVSTAGSNSSKQQ